MYFLLADFDGNALADNVTFIIKRIKVHTNSLAAGYKFPDTYGVETYLELFSEDNFDAFCLAYMFTYRDFEGGTLGLAWTGDLENAGGVCEKNGVRECAVLKILLIVLISEHMWLDDHCSFSHFHVSQKLMQLR